jgi:hypothetical protein
MIARTPTLAEWPYRMVRLACDLCPRRGQYRKDTLIARFGGDVLMPDSPAKTPSSHLTCLTGQDKSVFAEHGARGPRLHIAIESPGRLVRVFHENHALVQ